VTDEQDNQKPKPNQASALVKLAQRRYKLLISSDDGRAYAVSRDGANVALRTNGGFKSKLAKHFAQEHGTVPSQSALSDALTVLEGFAGDQDPEPLQLRVGRHREHVVLDLGTADGRCVVVSPDGWRRESRSPIVFRRTKAMQPLPDPIRDGRGLNPLRELLNVDEEGLQLMIGWMIAALLPEIPHPILALKGEQGTAKSMTARLMLGLIDPSGAPLRSAPRDVKSWVTSASASWTICLDNVSTIQPWLSDTLCRAVTGEGFVDRALFTDDDVVVLSFRRAIVMTTIDAGAMAGDLGERLLVVEPPLIPQSKRRSEQEVQARYEEARPTILAALLDLLSKVLAVLPDVHLASMPRMADFARVLAAVDEVMGWSTLDAYMSHADSVSADVLASDPFGQAVLDFVTERGTWTGTVTELLTALETPEPRPKRWPNGVSQGGGHVRRLAPALRDRGIDVTEDRVGKNRTRLLRLRATTPEK
jgi:hypothetical protein